MAAPLHTTRGIVAFTILAWTLQRWCGHLARRAALRTGQAFLPATYTLMLMVCLTRRSKYGGVLTRNQGRGFHPQFSFSSALLKTENDRILTSGDVRVP